jgi:predicted RNA-binding Zn-ribbon protein involved in translation (DUF1610 family)
MAQDSKAWGQMERYNKRDVIILERLYRRLLPWIKDHPNVGAYLGKTACTNCGSAKVNKQGIKIARLRHYQRYQCQDCGTWMQSSAPIARAPTTRLVS